MANLAKYREVACCIICCISSVHRPFPALAISVAGFASKFWWFPLLEAPITDEACSFKTKVSHCKQCRVIGTYCHIFDLALYGCDVRQTTFWFHQPNIPRPELVASDSIFLLANKQFVFDENPQRLDPLDSFDLVYFSRLVLFFQQLEQTDELNLLLSVFYMNGSSTWPLRMRYTKRPDIPLLDCLRLAGFQVPLPCRLQFRCHFFNEATSDLVDGHLGSGPKSAIFSVLPSVQ